MCKDKQSKMTPSPVQGKLTVLLEDVTCCRATENEEKVVGRTTGGAGGGNVTWQEVHAKARRCEKKCHMLLKHGSQFFGTLCMDRPGGEGLCPHP